MDPEELAWRPSLKGVEVDRVRETLSHWNDGEVMAFLAGAVARAHGGRFHRGALAWTFAQFRGGTQADALRVIERLEADGTFREASA